MEIKEGEYVRTVQGTIAKIEDLEFDIRVKFTTGLPMYRKVTKTNINTDSVEFEVIKKHSFKLIDLIEVGDYVNGMEVDEFDDVEGNIYLGFPIYDDSLMDCISEFRPLETVKIKSIVTKEQFESVKYEVM